MKSIHSLFGAFMLVLFSTSINAQEYDPLHKYSLEVRTGLASLEQRMSLPSYSVGSTNMELMHKNQSGANECIYNISFAQSYEINSKWALFFDLALYRCEFDVIDDGTGDFVQRNKYIHGPQCEVAVKYTWKRWEKMKIYSAVGVGFDLNNSLFFPWPHVTPIGVSYGANHFYGLFELDASVVNSGPVFGVGYRF